MPVNESIRSIGKIQYLLDPTLVVHIGLSTMVQGITCFSVYPWYICVSLCGWVTDSNLVVIWETPGQNFKILCNKHALQWAGAVVGKRFYEGTEKRLSFAIIQLEFNIHRMLYRHEPKNGKIRKHANTPSKKTHVTLQTVALSGVKHLETGTWLRTSKQTSTYKMRMRHMAIAANAGRRDGANSLNDDIVRDPGERDDVHHDNHCKTPPPQDSTYPCRSGHTVSVNSALTPSNEYRKCSFAKLDLEQEQSWLGESATLSSGEPDHHQGKRPAMVEMHISLKRQSQRDWSILLDSKGIP
ncbi:hypothetical protein BJV74DRAFT_988013 [Russula compacta]|nr:hypothetical protein BJV74DRAFT_988013 [Russula compacta]